jgi:hypothetical protein
MKYDVVWYMVYDIMNSSFKTVKQMFRPIWTIESHQQQLFQQFHWNFPRRLAKGCAEALYDVIIHVYCGYYIQPLNTSETAYLTMHHC